MSSSSWLFFKARSWSVGCEFRIRVWGSYRTSRSFGTGMEVLRNSEISGIVAQAYRTSRRSGRVHNVLYPYPRYCGQGRTEHPQVLCTGMNVVQNFQEFFVG